MKAALYTITALIAFAANSLLCRMALADGAIDAWNFTAIRLLSGAACLGLIMTAQAHYLRRNSLKRTSLKRTDLKRTDLKQTGNFDPAALTDKGDWLSAISLVVYALCFSVAYQALDTGTGALILFAVVQLTMIGWGIYNKEPLNRIQWLALLIALIGFVYLMLPSAATPSLSGALMMAISGAAWGIYSIRGKTCVSPLRTTGFNFLRSLVAVPILALIGMSYLSTISMTGVMLAVASGAIASGIGYSIWYVAMPLLKTTQSAVVQLCVPVLAALMGVVFLSEQLTLEFIIASSVILSAVLVFVLNKK
ncbi:MAG: EamA family transporter [Psychrobacter sp.]|uniref:DMT family transporter n=1 Tax=Psychrobacter maritimus TaxID=256325 RepID=UPI00248C0652|nr:EamA family transporter [Psychrobacter sp. WB2]MDX1787931.1 EamA family transporter [Psychrobacter sp.]WGV14170.1 EamA family transporter [Psychrobacter sp. WB2]